MIHAVLALAALAPTPPVSSRAADSPQAVESAKAPDAPMVEAGGAETEKGDERSEATARVADWIATSNDNGTLPYAIIDKTAAALFLFDAKGKPLGKTPVLIGIALGDEATPGVGSKNLAEIGPAEKTTPAGRFIAKYGLAAGRQRVLWVDYGTSVALHPVVTTNRKERRPQRLNSPTADDNRITFGCINVSSSFYLKTLRPLFRKKGGVVYVLPDTKPLEVVFPRLRVQPFITGGQS